jgi:hypothetical protein
MNQPDSEKCHSCVKQGLNCDILERNPYALHKQEIQVPAMHHLYDADTDPPDGKGQPGKA